MKFKNAVLTSQNNPVPSLQREVLMMIRKKNGAFPENRLKYRDVCIRIQQRRSWEGGVL